MKYFLNLFAIEFDKSCRIAYRYKFNTIFSIVFWAILMILLSNMLLQGNSENKTWGFICSFMIWLITNNTFIAVVDSILSETTQGTLEQLYLNAKSFFQLLVVKGIVAGTITVFQSVLTLSLCLLVVSQVRLSDFLQWIYVIPMLFISILSLVGFGIACASLALKHKNISSFYSMVSSIVFGILTYGAVKFSDNTIFMFLFPFAKANAALQMFLSGRGDITMNTVLIIIANDLLHIIIGYVFLCFLIRQSKRTGSLSKF